MLVPESFHISRPIRAALILTGVLTAFASVLACFGDIPPERAEFILYGAGYSALLSFGITGLFLLPHSLRRHAVRLVSVMGPMLILGMAALLLLLMRLTTPLVGLEPARMPTTPERWEISAAMAPLVLRVLLWGAAVFSAILCTLSCYGWFRWFKRQPASSFPGSSLGTH